VKKLSKYFCSSCGSQLLYGECPNKECPELKKFIEGMLNGNSDYDIEIINYEIEKK
jgi:hypothetical protein